MARNWRVAVIGRKGRHGHGIDAVWKAFDNVEVVGVADEDETARAATAKNLNAKAAFADYREMLEKTSPQIVSVADRFVDTHRDHCLACARAGASIYMEKPLSRTLAEADEIVAACEMRHVKLAIAHQTHLSPRMPRIKELIAGGKIGDVLEMRGRGIEDKRPASHDLISHGTHIFDLMRMFQGEARWCLGRVLQNGKPITKADVKEDTLENVGLIAGDKIEATYDFDKGVVASFGTFSTNPPTYALRFGLTILGTKGMIQLTTGSLPAAYFLDDPSWFPGKSKKSWVEISSAGMGKPEPLKDGGLAQGNVWIVEDLMDAIEKDRQPQSGLYDGRAVLEMIMGVYESQRLSKAVDLPLKNRQHPLAML